MTVLRAERPHDFDVRQLNAKLGSDRAIGLVQEPNEWVRGQQSFPARSPLLGADLFCKRAPTKPNVGNFALATG
jgi:hypothetical protein